MKTNVPSFGDIVGTAHVLTESEDVASYLTDWTGLYQATALAVVCPGSTEEVAELIKLCIVRNVAVVPNVFPSIRRPLKARLHVES